MKYIKVLYVLGFLSLLVLGTAKPSMAEPIYSLDGYACNTSQWDPYVKSLAGLPQQTIIAQLNQSCNSHIGDPIDWPPLEPVTSVRIYKVNKVTPCGPNNKWLCATRIENYTRVACAIKLKGFNFPTALGAWSVRVYPNGTVETDGVKCSNPAYCNPNDPRYTTFTISTTGMCYAIA
jgi:hypothetical protein